MWWETAIVLVAVGLSVAFLARSAVRSLSGRSSCRSGCGTCPSSRGKPRISSRAPEDFRGRFSRPRGESSS